MSIVKMKRLRLIGMQSERDGLLRQLQHLGCVEIDEPTQLPEEPQWVSLARPDAQALAQARQAYATLESALTSLNKYAPEKTGLLQPRPLISEKALFDPEAFQKALDVAEAVNEAERRMGAIRAEQSKLRSQKAQLQPWLELDVPLDVASTRDVTILLGAVSANTDWGAMQGAVDAATDLAELTRAGKDRDLQYLLLMVHNSAAQAVLDILKEYGFTRASLRGWSGTAAENDRRLETEIKALDEELEQVKGHLCSFAEQRKEVQLALDLAKQEIARGEAKDRLLYTGSAYFLEGWVPAVELPKLEKTLANFACAWETQDPTPEEYPQVPVKLKNNIFSRCMNVVTEMYSLPAYDGTDPNPLMAPFFIVFFGVMMADMGYGILMIAASLFVLLKTRPREGTRNFMELVFWCGISTLVVGALTGGFFGDFIPQIVKIVNPDSTFEMPALFTPLNDTVAIMLGSVVLGCVQIVTGMTVSVVNKIRSGDFIDALFDEITWWIILAGIALAIFGIGTVSGVPVVLLIGGLMLVLGGTRKAKGFGKLTTLVGLVYNGVTGFFSDALSYVRLMALMLSGSVIASVFNTLGATFGNVVLFVIIALIGNALNLALNLLGCYVHDLRLQCLEFFGRFYKEGGKPYRPLAIQTKYVDIMKEEN